MTVEMEGLELGQSSQQSCQVFLRMHPASPILASLELSRLLPQNELAYVQGDVRRRLEEIIESTEPSDDVGPRVIEGVRWLDNRDCAKYLSTCSILHTTMSLETCFAGLDVVVEVVNDRVNHFLR